jgi:hypothetical protein
VDSQGEIDARFEPVDAVRWLSGRLQIDDLETEGDLIEALEGVCDEIRDQAEGRPAIARITLTGRSVLHPVLRRPQVVEDLTERLRGTGMESAPPVWLEQIKVQTNTPIDLDLRRKSADFLGEVLRLLEKSSQTPAGLLEMLSELYNDRRGRRFLQIPAEEELRELLSEVENMCVDELVIEEAE